MFRFTLILAVVCFATSVASADDVCSHPAIRTLPTAADRPLGKGPVLYVDVPNGSDESDGSKDKAWKTITHALKQLSAGDTLYLRGGTYCEQAYRAAAGTADKPITIRAYPGELATIDGSFREFFESPADAWAIAQ